MSNYESLFEQYPLKSIEVRRLHDIEQIPTPELDPNIIVYQGSWERDLPGHYADNSLTQKKVVINVILPNGVAQVPTSQSSNFEKIYLEVAADEPQLYEAALRPGGAIKAAGSESISPIKALIRNYPFPGDESHQGWDLLAQEAEERGNTLLLSFQGNGLYFNRGSMFFDGQRIIAHPDMELAEKFASSPSAEEVEQLSIYEANLKSPLSLLATLPDGTMRPHYFEFQDEEPYEKGIRRLEEDLKRSDVQSAFSASPPLVIPDDDSAPQYVSLEKALTTYHASDMRHLLYLPFQGGEAVLFPELARFKSRDGAALAHSLSGKAEDRISFPVKETLVTAQSLDTLAIILDQRGYAGRYEIDEGAGTISINPLPGVYSHNVPGVTRSGKFVLLQTSGTHGNITGNDGPTFDQLGEIIQDINSQPPFSEDPIISAFSGSQGNDVPNITALSSSGEPGLLADLAPQTKLPSPKPTQPRGKVTTPRIGVVAHKAGPHS